MPAVNFNMRLDQDLKDRAAQVLECYGLTTAQAIKLFLNQVAETRSVPLSFDYVKEDVLNQQTKTAVRQGRYDYQAGNLTKYNEQEMMQVIDKAVS